jgi:hypothetical protein
MRFPRQLPTLTLLLFTFLVAAPTVARAQAGPSDADCALARDPVRCLGRADAIAACANLHGTLKRDCLLTRLPPPDCKAAPNPARCEVEQDAKEACKTKTGKALSDCLRDNGVQAPMRPKAKKKAVEKKKLKKPTPSS